MSRNSGFWVALSALLVGSCHSSTTSDDGCARVPGLTADECASLATYVLPEAIPDAHGNAHANDDRAAQLGFQIFFDARFSSNESVRCATCHLPERFFQDGLPVSKGVALASRNAPTIANCARMRWIFWDGRADSIWSQPLFALEHPNEMGFDRVAIAQRIAKSYAADYQAIFGALPPLDDAARFPQHGKPGDASWSAMSAEDQHAVNLVAANVGKALEAYERHVVAGRSAFDRFLLGDDAALDATQLRGLAVFFRAGCASCHSGPMLSDDQFHRLGGGSPDDHGRAAGLVTLGSNPFRGDGVYADPPLDPAPPAPTPQDDGAFRTPSLRNLTRTAPYGHEGRFATLRDVVQFHLDGGSATPFGPVDPLLKRTTIAPADLDALLSFLASLDGVPPPKPWGDWPDR